MGGKTLLLRHPLLIEPSKAKLLKKLSAETRLSQQTLLREAVDDLLVKYRKLREQSRKP